MRTQIQISQLHEWLSPLAKKDSVEFDLHGFSQEQTKISFEKKDLYNSCFETQHLNLRVLQGEKSGTSYTKEFSKSSVEACYQRALNGLKFSDKKEKGKLCQNEKYEDFSRFYDKDFKNISAKSKIQKAREMNQACWNMDTRVQPEGSLVRDCSEDSFFINSKGLQSSYKTNNVAAYCSSLAIQGDSRANGYIETHNRDYKEIDFKTVGSDSASNALKKLNYKIPKTKRYPVVFQAGQATSALLSQLVHSLNGKTVYDGLSLFKEDLGKPVFSSNFSLYDDPLALWGRHSQPFDGEGFATEQTCLVKDGAIQNYLTSSFIAETLKVPHTKKACWNNEPGAYGMPGILSIAPTNLVMQPGSSSFEDMMGEFSQLVVIDFLKGESGYNMVSGDFSVESEGFLWEGGESHPLCQFTVSGNIKDLFSQILKVGSDSQICTLTSSKSPSFLVPNLMIAGK